jgi:cell pole-organizing protein PopZ
VAGDERPASGGGRSVEELVVELLRPQLKEWLDQNLAPLVERVVEQEVKKLARRAELM